MLTKILALIQIWDDVEKEKTLFAPDESLLAIEAEGHQEFVSGRFRIASGDPAFNVPRGSLTTIRAALIIIEGAPGADITINGAAAAREFRPPTDAEDAATNTPRCFYLETCTDLSDPVPFEIAHPGGSTDAISGVYVLVGDPTA